MPFNASARVTNTTTGNYIDLPPIAGIKWGPLKATGTSTATYPEILSAGLYHSARPFPIPGAINLECPTGTWEVDFTTTSNEVAPKQFIQMFCLNLLDNKSWDLDITNQLIEPVAHTEPVQIRSTGIEAIDSLIFGADPILILPIAGTRVGRNTFGALAAISPSSVPLEAFAINVVIDQPSTPSTPATYKIDYSIPPSLGLKTGVVGLFNFFHFEVPPAMSLCVILLIRNDNPSPHVFQSDVQRPFQLV